MTPLAHATRYDRALEDVRRGVAVKTAAYQREGRRSSGVCMSGMDPAHYMPPTEAEMEAEARERADRMAAQACTWKGRLRIEVAAAERALREALIGCEEIKNAISRGDDSADILARIARLHTTTDQASACVEAAQKVVA